MLSVKAPLASSMRTRSSPASGVDDDPLDVLALEAEVGRAVVTEVDLEDAGLAGLQAKRDLVARGRALDRQDAVPELRVRLLGARGLALLGHDARPRRRRRRPTAANCCDAGCG